jgi:hypothetical protein
MKEEVKLKNEDLSADALFFIIFFLGEGAHKTTWLCNVLVPRLSFSMSTEFDDADDFSVQTCVCAVAALKVAQSAGSLMTLTILFSVCVNILFFLQDTVGRCQIIFKKH